MRSRKELKYRRYSARPAPESAKEYHELNITADRMNSDKTESMASPPLCDTQSEYDVGFPIGCGFKGFSGSTSFRTRMLLPARRQAFAAGRLFLKNTIALR